MVELNPETFSKLCEEAWFFPRDENNSAKDRSGVLAYLVRLSRNSQEYLFPHRMGKRDSGRLLGKSERFFRNLDGSLGGPWMDALGPGVLISGTRERLKEALLPLPLEDAFTQKLFTGKNNAIGGIVNQIDHFRLWALGRGLEGMELFTSIKRAEESLENEFPFAVNLQWGYLSSDLSNLGTSLKARVILHLPALLESLDVEALAGALELEGLSLFLFEPKPSFKNTGLIILENTTSLGMSEEEIFLKLDDSARILLHYEQNARESLYERDPALFEDQVWRAKGILKNCRRIDETEAVALLSQIRRGVGICMVPEEDYLASMMFFIQEGHLAGFLPSLGGEPEEVLKKGEDKNLKDEPSGVIFEELRAAVLRRFFDLSAADKGEKRYV